MKGGLLVSFYQQHNTLRDVPPMELILIIFFINHCQQRHNTHIPWQLILFIFFLINQYQELELILTIFLNRLWINIKFQLLGKKWIPFYHFAFSHSRAPPCSTAGSRLGLETKKKQERCNVATFLFRLLISISRPSRLLFFFFEFLD